MNQGQFYAQFPETGMLKSKELTNTQKWGLVIGLTAGIYALLYYVNKIK